MLGGTLTHHVFERRGARASDARLFQKVAQGNLQVEQIIFIVVDGMFEKFIVVFDELANGVAIVDGDFYLKKGRVQRSRI